MRYPSDQKQKTRRTILEAAGRVFRRQGYHGGGVDAVMEEAGLTHGGFYSHFRNKEALFAESVLETMIGLRNQHGRWTEGLDGDDWLRAFLGGYLSGSHRSQAEHGCLAPPLISELGRSGDGPRQKFEQGLRWWAEDMGRHLRRIPEPQRADAALGIISTCVGALATARAVADPELADRVLESARDLILRAYIESPADEPNKASTQEPTS